MVKALYHGFGNNLKICRLPDGVPDLDLSNLKSTGSAIRFTSCILFTANGYKPFLILITGR